MDFTKDSVIGTVVGNTSTGEYSFVLKRLHARLGDIVVTRLDVPHHGLEGEKHRAVVVWGRVTSIDRFNPFFPFEAAQELADESINLSDTPLSISRDQLQATVLILGMSNVDSEDHMLSPLTYPVQPASEVYYPDASAIRKLLTGAQSDPVQLRIGSLIARNDVEVALSASKIVSRHLAILAMTGGGKTVAVRRIMRELMDIGYPLLVFDPHGDYLGLYEKESEFPNNFVKLFYPHLTWARQHENVVFDLIEKMGLKLTDPQREFLGYLVTNTNATDGIALKQYINELSQHARNVKKKKGKGDIEMDIQVRTMSVVIRCLEEVSAKLYKMQANNARLRDRFPDFKFDEMPNPLFDPEQLIAKGQVSIFYLAGYDHLTQSMIVSMVLESLFDHRANLNYKIPPFQAVLEEAHNFIPSRGEGTTGTPSLGTVRKVITEGRKFGTGMIIVSQRPNRLDETILSQCNSFLVLRLVNPQDQNFVRRVMENLSDSDARLLPTFGPGQGIVSGQAVRFPLLTSIDFDRDLISQKIGDENFVAEVSTWSNEVGQKKNSVDQDVSDLPKGKRGSVP